MSKTKDWDNESNEVKSNWLKWNVYGDKVIGTLVEKRQVKSTMPGKEGELVWVYDLKCDGGSFHEADDNKKVIEEPVVINAGDFYSIGGKAGIDAQMRNIKLGQKVGFKYIDETPSKTKGFAPTKNIRVYAPKNDDGTYQMDEEWLAEQEKTANDGFGNL